MRSVTEVTLRTRTVCFFHGKFFQRFHGIIAIVADHAIAWPPEIEITHGTFREYRMLPRPRFYLNATAVIVVNKLDDSTRSTISFLDKNQSLVNF